MMDRGPTERYSENNQFLSHIGGKMSESNYRSGNRERQKASKRRTFLKTAAGIGVVAAAGPGSAEGSQATDIPDDQPPVSASKMPMTAIGDTAISRLVIGANTMWGYSHRGSLLTQLMMEYYSTEQVVKVLRHAESCGINAWQTNFRSRDQNLAYPSERVVAAITGLRESGSKMRILILVTPSDFEAPDTWRRLLAVRPTALVTHGAYVDRAWVDGKMSGVRDVLKRFRDAGVLVGCSMHTPEAMAFIEKEAWDIDFYMASFYRGSQKLRERWLASLGHKPLHEMYLEGIPELMCPVIRQVSKPVLAYKVLAAGRLADRPGQIEEAFTYAFRNIKPQDGIIVGVFPKFRDQVAESAHLTIRYGSAGS
jgi:hypothetical protein